MKRVFTLILAAALVLSIGATSAFAAAADTGVNYIDADGDGVCDNCPGGLCPRDGTGRHSGHGAGFIDDDDGGCDNLGARPLDGTGFGRRCGRNK